MPANTDEKRVLVALSGGVDSSACVYLLQKQGYTVEAAVLDLHPAASNTVEAAKENSAKLDVPLHIISRHDEFKAQVIIPFCEEYRAGRTPNPCIMCNPAIKFKLICDMADSLNIKYIATGHYAGIVPIEDNGRTRFLLHQAQNLQRDQSYMLYRLGQNVLSRLLLPLQALSKSEVRQIAESAGLPAAKAPDSQEICFIPNNNYAGYIEALTGKVPCGDFIAPDGTICGRHSGILHYTVGQRKHLGIALGRPVFIKKIDAVQNRIYLADGGDEYAESAKLCSCFLQAHPLMDSHNGDSTICNGHSTFKDSSAGISCKVKIRSVAQPAAALVKITQGDKAQAAAASVVFEEAQRAPAPGQSMVWYTNDGFVLGGGIIA
ncbi:MAG: tRNA 2-thiouridine(34) synthase MnmA [Hydrogenoanaerobacterium sp.]